MSETAFKNLIPRSIAYSPIYRELSGSLTGAILLSQLVYWASKKEKFWKTDQDLMEETGLTAKEMKTAKKKMKEIPFIKITVEGIPATTWYEFNYDKWAETVELVGPKGTNCKVRKGPTVRSERDQQYTKTTSKTTSNTPTTQKPVVGSVNGKKKSHRRWTKFAEQLGDAISAARGLNSNANVPSWSESFRKLNEMNKMSIPRIRKVLKWYCSQIKKGDLITDNSNYLPVAYSGPVFREKFLRIEDAMVRADSQYQEKEKAKTKVRYENGKKIFTLPPPPKEDRNRRY